jgi:hypothetical protein
LHHMHQFLCASVGLHMAPGRVREIGAAS